MAVNACVLAHTDAGTPCCDVQLPSIPRAVEEERGFVKARPRDLSRADEKVVEEDAVAREAWTGNASRRDGQGAPVREARPISHPHRVGSKAHYVSVSLASPDLVAEHQAVQVSQSLILRHEDPLRLRTSPAEDCLSDRPNHCPHVRYRGVGAQERPADG